VRPAENINELIRKLHVKASADLDKRVHDEISMALAESRKTESAPPEPNIWRIIMKSPITKLATAAVVIIACVIGLSLWRTTGSGILLAEVLARVEQARSVRWTVTGSSMMSSDAVPSKFSNWGMRITFLISQEWGQMNSYERTDPNDGKIPVQDIYFSLQKKTTTTIDHASKRYTRLELDDAMFRRVQEGLTRASDPAMFLKRIMKCKYESLGRSTVDGVEVEGFRTTDPNIGGFPGIIDPQVDEKLWVDVKTRMPVRLEQNGSGAARTGGRISIHGVLDHFQWDLPLTGAEFEPPTIPNGYLIVVDNLPGPITEEGTIQGLKQCVELLGKYPGSISVAPPEGIQSELDQSESTAATQLKDELKGLMEQDRINRLMDAGTPMRRVYRFFMGLMDDRKDAAYYGNIVTPKNADKVLMRWKVSDSEYRVIFGDLHAETVTPERLAELEAALPK